MFPLDLVPSTLLTLMAKFRNVARVRVLVRSQLLVRAETTFAFVQAQYPSLDLELISKADADVCPYYPFVRHPASIALLLGILPRL
jgi:hypothetical protein